MSRYRVFISSVQKELENERIGAQEILWTDPFLKNHCDPVLYEFEPASPRDATKECLDEIDSCQYFTLIIGNRVKLDEYPVEALREALVNAVAHRRYEQDGQKILLNVFCDRVVVSSPGRLPSPLKITDLRKGNYRPCSRNPSVAQGLSFFHRIEERGSGMGRMRDEMLNHGLDKPTLGTKDGYFEVSFYGPGDDLERLKVPTVSVSELNEPSVEAQLNDRQKDMLLLLIEGQELTSRFCQETFDVVKDTVNRDFQLLRKLDLAEKVGGGRSTRYRLKR